MKKRAKSSFSPFLQIIKRIYITISPLILIVILYFSIRLFGLFVSSGFFDKILNPSLPAYDTFLLICNIIIMIIMSAINFVPFFFINRSIKEDDAFPNFRYINTLINIFITTLLTIFIFVYIRSRISSYADIIEPTSFSIFLPIIIIVLLVWIISTIIKLIKPRITKDFITSTIFFIFTFAFLIYPFTTTKDDLVYKYLNRNNSSIREVLNIIEDKISKEESIKNVAEITNPFIENNFRQIEIMVLNDQKEPYKLFNSSCNEYYGNSYNIARITTETEEFLNEELIKSYIDTQWGELNLITEYSRRPSVEVQSEELNNNDIKDATDSSVINGENDNNINTLSNSTNGNSIITDNRISEGDDEGENLTNNEESPIQGETKSILTVPLQQYKSGCYMHIRNKAIEQNKLGQEYSWIKAITDPINIENIKSDNLSPNIDTKIISDNTDYSDDLSNEYKRPSLLIYITKHEIDLPEGISSETEVNADIKTDTQNAVDSTNSVNDLELNQEEEIVDNHETDVSITISLFDYIYTVI